MGRALFRVIEVGIIAELDGPDIIWAGTNGIIMRLVFAGRGEVDAGIVHDGTGKAVILRIYVIGLIIGPCIGCLHVVVKAKCVPNLMQHQVINRFLNQFCAGFRAASQHGAQGFADHIVQLQVPRHRAVALMRAQPCHEGLGFIIRFVLDAQCGIFKHFAGIHAVGKEAIFQHDIGPEDLAGARVGEAGPVPL